MLLAANSSSSKPLGRFSPLPPFAPAKPTAGGSEGGFNECEEDSIDDRRSSSATLIDVDVTAAGAMDEEASHSNSNSNFCHLNLTQLDSLGGLSMQTAPDPTPRPMLTQEDSSRGGSGGGIGSEEDLTMPAGVGISEALAWVVLRDIGAALSVLHSRGMVHLDVRPANILLTTAPQHNRFADAPQDDVQLLIHNQGLAQQSSVQSLFQSVMHAAQNRSMESAEAASSSERSERKPLLLQVRQRVEDLVVRGVYLMKLADFGHCCLETERAAIEEGETRYCAPELICDDALRASEVRKADIFSLGAAVYELCLGRPLSVTGEGMSEWHRIRNQQLDTAEMQRSAAANGQGAGYSSQLIAMLQRMLHPTPAQRPAAEDVTAAAVDALAADASTAAFAAPSAQREAALERENAELKRQLEALRLQTATAATASCK